MLPNSLRGRLSLAVGAVALVAIAGLALSLRYETRREFLRLQEVQRQSLSAALPGVVSAVASDLDGRCCSGETMATASARLPPDAAVLVVDEGGGKLLASAGVPLRGLLSLQTATMAGSLDILATRVSGSRFEDVRLTLRAPGTRLRMTDGSRAILYVIPFPGEERTRQSSEFLGAVDRRLLATAALVACAALLATALVARGLTAPLDDLRSATRALARGELGRRVSPRGGAEIAELGRAFNAMAAELERQQGVRRDLVHDVAHELRTPLTALQCRVESVLDGLAPDPTLALEDVREEVLHLGRLVDDLQDVALAEARELRLEMADVSLEPIIRSALRAAGLETSPLLRLEAAPNLTVHADPGRTRQVILNLLSNAARYTAAGGRISVSAAATGDEVRVEVTNSGSALTPEQIGRLFDRFYRTDPSRQRVTGGTGLGLAVVKHLVEAQGGRVWARSGENTVTVGFLLRLGALER